MPAMLESSQTLGVRVVRGSSYDVISPVELCSISDFFMRTVNQNFVVTHDPALQPLNPRAI